MSSKWVLDLVAVDLRHRASVWLVWALVSAVAIPWTAIVVGGWYVLAPLGAVGFCAGRYWRALAGLAEVQRRLSDDDVR